MTERQPTPGVHEPFAPILDDSGQGSGLWCEPAEDGRDQARDYSGTSHQAASAGHARGWRQALDAAVYVTTSVLGDMIVAGSGDLQEAHGKAIDAITSLYAATPAPEPHVMPTARAFMDLFVVDNGDERCLSIKGIDMIELTHRFAALEAALATTEGSDNGR